MPLALPSRPEDEATDLSPMDRRVSQGWATAPRLIATALTLVIAAVGLLAFMKYGLTSTWSVAAERVLVAQVRVGAFQDYVPVSGTVQPRETVYLDAIDGGQVLEVFVEAGSMVVAGQSLARLRNANLQLQVFNSEAQLSEQLNRLTATRLAFEQAKLAHARELIEVRFQIERAQQQLARMHPLVNTGAIKRADIEEAQLDLARLEQMQRELTRAAKVDARLQHEQIEQLDRAVKGLSANLNLARHNLESLTIKAPLNGQLTALEAHRGESKLPGQRMGQIDQLEFKVVALVDEHYLARVAAGQRATTWLDGHQHRMQLSKVYPEVRDRQFKVDLEFGAAAPAAVRRGQTLDVKLELGASSDGLVLANGAFYEDSGGQWAFVIGGSGIAQRRAVKFGRRNPEQLEVLAGLAAGERVITSSYATLKQFERIELRGDLTNVTTLESATRPAGAYP